MDDDLWPATATSASVPAVLGDADREYALLLMIEAGAQDSGTDLRRWAQTEEAQPILREYLLSRTRPLAGEYCAVLFPGGEVRHPSHETGSNVDA